MRKIFKSTLDDSQNKIILKNNKFATNGLKYITDRAILKNSKGEKGRQERRTRKKTAKNEVMEGEDGV